MTHDAAVGHQDKVSDQGSQPNPRCGQQKKQVVLLHNIKILGGTTINLTNKVAALFGLGPDAQVVALDVDAAITTQSKRTQPAADIIAAAAIGTDSLRALRAPTQGDTNFNGLSMFTPAPFLRKAILKAMTPCPFEISSKPQLQPTHSMSKSTRTTTVSLQETSEPTATCSSCGV